MDFAILGRLEARHGGRPLEPGRPKQRALLAILLLHPNEVVSTHRLVEDLWERGPPGSVAASLQAHVSRLRSALAPAVGEGPSPIATVAPGYRMEVAVGDLDSLRFRELAARGRGALGDGDVEAALELLESALALWRGTPLAELPLGAYARADVARLEEQRLTTLEDLIDAELALGRHRDLLGRLDALVADHPLRERLWAQRIVALYRSGRQAEALRAYGDVRRTLATELGIDPGPELQRLEVAILAQRPELEWAAPLLAAPRTAPVPAAPSTPPEPDAPVAPPAAPRRIGNLPVPLTTFVGRSVERAELAELLAERRLVTLTGFGGAGKTRLAVEVAQQSAGRFPAGTWFADLSPVTDALGVGRAVAGVIGVVEEPARPLVDSLADALAADAPGLLVLDNCEQVTVPAAALASALLQRSPQLRVLATSREPLGVAGEACFAVPSLSLPGLPGPLDEVVASEAVQLFVDRARLVRRDFRLTQDNTVAVASICHRLDGIPLAIELAAGRLSVLSAQQIDERLADRFRLLADEVTGRPERHRTLAATMEWSDALLGSVERVLLRRLSVFCGSFALDAAEAVCSGGVVERDQLLDHLARLVAKSLVVAETGGREARYRLLETIRQHAADRLSASGDAPDVCTRHAGWCLELAERAEPELSGPRQPPWLERLTAEHDNLRSALSWALGRNDAELAQRLAGALVLFWRIRGHALEGREWLATALKQPGAVPEAVRAKALWGSGFLALMASNPGAAVPVLEQSVALFRELDDRRGQARGLLLLGNARRFTDGSLVALLLLDEAVGLARRVDDHWCLAHGLALAGSLHVEDGHLHEAEAMLTEALELARSQDDLQGCRAALWGLGQLRALEGRLALAEEALFAGLRLSRQLHEPHATASLAANLADVHCARGEHHRAEELLAEADGVMREGGAMAAVEVLCARGGLAQARGDLDGARARYADALAVARVARSTSIRGLLGLAEVALHLGEVDLARRAAEEAHRVSEGIGSRRGRAWVLEIAGRLARAEGRDGAAWSFHRDALVLRRQGADLLGMARSLGALGGLAAARSSAEEGAVLLGAAAAVRERCGVLLPPADRDAGERDVGSVRAILPERAFAAAWAKGASLPLGEAVDLALALPDEGQFQS